ncbi:VC0807 family protein [Rugosimonospora africana]|uniref:Intracellular septation protein A n=1 Tax=Rugosimonospora africana TaxID=556532 RepID=A0A8J3QVM5_9ACTN|nr:VC0807 family protein [Rugosimonospora africana]GIH18330.1 hypothetical protein Raf01_65020 [Rugosimonospora africana]
MKTTGPPGVRGALLRSAAIDLIGPTVAYYALRGAGLSTVVATLLAALLPLGNAALVFARRRQVDQLACLAVVVLGVLVLATVLGGGERLALAKDGLITGIAGLYALGTLTARRPLYFTVARPFGQEPDEDWDASWEADPVFRHQIRTINTVWGTGLSLDGIVKVLLAYTLPADAVPAVAGIQYVVVLGGLVLFTVRYVRRGDRRRYAAAGSR